MFSRYFFLISLILLLSLLPGGVRPAQAAEGACLAWDISGVWDYSASAGGWGTFTFQQNPSTGELTGTWHNKATGARGTVEDGGVVGSAVGFHPAPTTTNRGTVSADGTTISGTYIALSGSGTWVMRGQARCTVRQAVPPEGSARVTVWWGTYVYRLELDPAVGLAINRPQVSGQVPRIVAPFGALLEIEVVYYGEDLPQSMEVINRWDGQRERVGSLSRRWTTEDGGVVYVGTATIPQRRLGPGERIVNEVRVVNPWGREDLVIYVDQVIVDPSGYIYDADTNERIQGAMVSCYEKEGNSWVLWDAEPWKQTNPLVSNEVGHYGWDVPQGDYKVLVSRACYQDAESPVVTVPPPRTDVHFALKKVACSALDLIDVWTSDKGALPRGEFLASEPIQYHAQVANSGTSDVSVELAWTVTDPDGKRVGALSGSGTYDIAGFGAKLAIDETLPSNLSEGTYALTVHLTHQQQTSLRMTQFSVKAREERSVYLPLVLRNYRASPAQRGIHGRVTYKGKAAAGITLHLELWDGSSVSTAATTRTDGDGRYLFVGVPSLGSGESYNVRYGRNRTDARYLADWLADPITSYISGTPAAGGDFDIANIELLSPKWGATVKPPQTFTWSRRGVAGDSYRWRMFDPTGDTYWMSGDLGDNGSYTLPSMPGGVVYGKEYRWFVRVYRGLGSYGQSFHYGTISFSAAMGQTIQPQLYKGTKDRSD